MTKITYSLSTGIPPTSSCARRPALALLLQALHLLREPLLRGEEASLHHVLHLRQLAAGLELPAQALEVALEPRHRLAVDGELLALSHQLPGQERRLAPDLVELALQTRDAALEVFPGLLDGLRLAHADEREQQDDRPEAAADAVEEGQAEHLDVAPRAPLHGQSFDGVRKDPRVAMASFQNAGAAMGSPSMG